MNNKPEKVTADLKNVRIRMTMAGDQIDLDSFVKKPELEPYLAAISNGAISKMASNGAGVGSDYDYYPPSTIDYFAVRGFYPFCLDLIHNKLSILVNKRFKFPRYLFTPVGEDGNDLDEEQESPPDEANDYMAFASSFECYCPVFFSTLPKAISRVIQPNVENLDFKFVEPAIFDGVLPYVKNPAEIRMYELGRRISENRDKGVITEDFDSVASEILDMILTHAVTNRATDVHIEYTGSNYRARIRVDGDLKDYPVPLDGKYYAALINVIRIRCEIDAAEHFRPQDGAMQFDCSFVDKSKISSYYDIRVSVIPQVDGRLNAVLRIQPKGEFKRLDELGFTTVVHSQVERLCKEPHGLILVTGPTGCGKTTTLYSLLNELNTNDVKILTVEDPPEIRMDGLTQVAINEKQGRTFPTMLRSFLRHDPDIILVGEIRDSETAVIAINAANTGHLVLSTLHTNDAVSAIKRLGNMEKVDPADFAFSLKGILAQRLIKTFKKDVQELIACFLRCGKPDDVLQRMIDKGGMSILDLGQELNVLMDENFFPEGSRTCFQGDQETYSGRTAITEFWKLGNRAADLVFDKNFSTMELAKVALQEDKMIPMAITGIEKIVKGETSLDNLLKAVGVETIRMHRQSIMDTFFK